MPDEKGKGSLESALSTLKDAVADLTSLEVQTYTGDLDVVIKEWKGITNFEEILKNVKAKGNLKLKYVTKINFDGDGFVLVPETAPPDHIQEAHNAALKAGQDARIGLLSLFSEVTGLAVKVIK